MESSGATPISLAADSCSANENRCHIATPAPPTPFPYSSMSPYGAINPFSFMSRYSSAGAAHLQSAFSSPLASSLPPGLAYPADIYHYNPFSALTPTSPLSPSSFWSLTAQQSYHQLNGITFGPSGPVSYNTNAHLFNIFSPNSMSPMSPSPDLHSPSLYPRVSSMPSPYASSPGLSSAFMSPSSMPLLLSPSLSSSVDRPPTYLSDNTSAHSTPPSMTPSIKCEPIEHNCSSYHTSHLMANNFNDNSIDKSYSIERHKERVDKTHERHSKKQNNNSISSKLSFKESPDFDIKHQSNQKTITTTITASKTREKHSARVEPLMRSTDETIDCVVLNGRRDVTSDLSDKTVGNNNNKHKTCEASPIKSVRTPNIDESRDKDRIDDNIIKDNKDLKSTKAKVKRELIECDMGLPSNTTDSVPNCNEMTGDSNASDVIANNTSESGPKTYDNSLVENHLIDENSQMDDKNLIIDDNSSSSNDSKDVLVVDNCQKNVDPKIMSNNSKQSKDAKRESQLKQLQSYRKESHRVNGNKPSVNTIQSQPLNGIETNAAISIVLPKPKEQISSQHMNQLSVKLVNQSSNLTNQSQASPTGTGCALNNVLSSNSPPVKLTSASLPVTSTVQNRTQSKAQGVITCRTKPVPKISANNSSANLTQLQKQSINAEKTATIRPNQTNGHKLPQTNSTTKQLPKKPRISQKTSSASIPIGIAIAQQRTSPKTKSPNDSNTNASQPLKPILPTLSLPVMANSPILITDSPPAGTSLWIKPTSNTTLTNNTSIQSNSQFSLTGDYQLARDSLTGHLYLIRNSSSLPTTPTTTPKPQTIIPPLTIKSNEHQSKSSPSAIITLPVGAAQPQQFFASLGQTQTSTLILDTTNSAPLVKIGATAPVTNLITTNGLKCVRHVDPKAISAKNNIETVNSAVNVERGCQASISDDELTCDNMKTTATQVDMDSIHSSEEDEDNEGKRHKLRIFSERKIKSSEKRSSVDDDYESSRDSVHLQIVDEAADEPPQLPVKSAPVMQFIDHHGLDLLVDSIEEFAAREESDPPSAEQPVNGLQLLSTLAEQRALEERSDNDSSALRRHSADSHINGNGLKSDNQITNDLNLLKRRQRSESCFTTNPIKFDENQQIFSDIKKLMKTSGCQTDDRRIDRFDNSFINLRRSERIFINDSVVSNVKDVITTDVNNKDKDLLPGKELKRKDGAEHKCKVVSNDSKVISSEKNVSNSEQFVRANPKDQYVFTDTKSDDMVPNLIKFPIINNKTKTNDSLVFCDIIKTNNQKIVSDLFIDSKKDDNIEQQIVIKKKKKKKNKLLSTSASIDNPIDEINGVKRVKKRKKRPTEEVEETKKRLKTVYDKQIDDSIETIVKRVSQFDEAMGESPFDTKPTDGINKEKKIISEDFIKTNENKVFGEKEDIFKKKRPLVKTSFELYDQKRMRLLDETIDEIIAKQLVPIEEQTTEMNNEIIANVEQKTETTELKTVSTQSSETTHSPPIEPPPPPEEPPKTVSAEPESKPKPLVKQSSNLSIISTSSSASSLSESCHSLTTHLNLKLSESDLDLKLNVIMLVDGLLFVGQICPIQPPDIYGIILHGERQHRPIIYSQEEMLKEAIREVKPSYEDLEEGQRVCAYWSTQYRHLYPGFVRSSSPHPNLVFVEFDDGDNGRISINDIRLLPQDYPQMKTSADPLKNLDRRRRMSSCGKDNRRPHSEISSDTKIEEKKNSAEEMSKTIKNKTNEESKPNSMKDSNKKDKNLKNKSNKSCNTSSDKTIPSHESSVDRLSLKSDSKKKKKKHNKEDRHHRHHHKHHHCRHHRKCKKRKKSKDENSSTSNSGSPNVSNFDSCYKTDKSDDKTNKTFESSPKTIKFIAMKSTLNESKSLEDSIESQNHSIDNQNDNSKNIISFNSGDNKDNNRTPLKTVIKKTPKQRALDRLQTNLSESFLTITSPVRKRYSNESNKDTGANAPTPKKRERMPSAEKSKIAAFLPERQLWHWSGKYIRRTGNKGSRTRKVYYREIERGREHIRVDDCAVFLSTGRPHLPYIGRIDSMWQTGTGTMIVKVRWFYHPEETKGQPVPLLDKRGALFESSHFDVNDVQTISHKCQVISWTEYQEKRRENPLMVSDDPPNVYYLAGQYEALAGKVEMDPTVPLKDSEPKDQITDKCDKTEIKT